VGFITVAFVPSTNFFPDLHPGVLSEITLFSDNSSGVQNISMEHVRGILGGGDLINRENVYNDETTVVNVIAGRRWTETGRGRTRYW